MIEKIRAIRNPLTIIAIFAALAEIAGTVALAIVDAQYQGVFIWFVMLFPTFLVACFFLTLNFNPKVLYAPSDFQNEENFLHILTGTHQVTSGLQSINVDLENLRREVLAKIPEGMASVRETDRQQLAEFLQTHLDAIRKQVERTHKSAESLSSDFARDAYPKSSFQLRILSHIADAATPVEGENIAETLGMSKAATFRALERLEQRGLIESVVVRVGELSASRLRFQIRGSPKEKTQPTVAGDIE